MKGETRDGCPPEGWIPQHAAENDERANLLEQFVRREPFRKSFAGIEPLKIAIPVLPISTREERHEPAVHFVEIVSSCALGGGGYAGMWPDSGMYTPEIDHTSPHKRGDRDERIHVPGWSGLLCMNMLWQPAISDDDGKDWNGKDWILEAHGEEARCAVIVYLLNLGKNGAVQFKVENLTNLMYTLRREFRGPIVLAGLDYRFSTSETRSDAFVPDSLVQDLIDAADAHVVVKWLNDSSREGKEDFHYTVARLAARQWLWEQLHAADDSNNKQKKKCLVQ